jgi:hypothetical protein
MEASNEGLMFREKPVREIKLASDGVVSESVDGSRTENPQAQNGVLLAVEKPVTPIRRTEQDHVAAMRRYIEQGIGLIDTLEDTTPRDILGDFAKNGLKTRGDFEQYGVRDELLKKLGVVKEARGRISSLESKTKESSEIVDGISKSRRVMGNIGRETLELAQKVYFRPTYERGGFRCVIWGEELLSDIFIDSVVPHFALGLLASVGVTCAYATGENSVIPLSALAPIGLLAVPIASNIASGAYEYLREKCGEVR